VAVRAENAASAELCGVIKQAIEEEKKLQDELRIKFMDFLVDQKVHYYIDPPPPKLPVLEEVRSDRFSIPQLRCLLKDLQKMSKGERLVEVDKVMDLFMRKLQMSKSLADKEGLPSQWHDFSLSDFQVIGRNLDKTSTGLLDWRKLMVYIALLRSSMADESKLKSFFQSFDSNYPDRESFSSVNTFILMFKAPAWFDKYELSEDRDYSIPYPRVRYVKEVIFDTLEEEGRVDTEVIAKVLKARDILLNRRLVKTYGDLILTV